MEARMKKGSKPMKKKGAIKQPPNVRVLAAQITSDLQKRTCGESPLWEIPAIWLAMQGLYGPHIARAEMEELLGKL
jgi:hypothetical protein